MTWTIAALYQFARFPDPAAVQGPLAALGRAQGIVGTLLLAREGINGTIAGPKAGIGAMIAHIRTLPGCANLAPKYSEAVEQPFNRFKVRIKAEIVTMGQPDVNPLEGTGHYVSGADWNELIAQPDVVVIDTRNDYEVEIGTFEGAIDPHTASFRDFPAWWAANKDRFHNKRIAMYCTGGIRCEKSTNFLRGQGVEDVYHLQGGILQYLEDMPAETSTWQGDCFVFDGRVSVGHGLVEGPHQLCHACRRPLVPADFNRPEFEAGVSCHRCIEDYTPERREGFRERQRQMALSRARGERHLGPQDQGPA